MDFDKLKIAGVYNKARAWVPRAERIWFKEIKKLLPGRNIETVLDLGCGTGRLILFLKKIFPKAKVIGIEPAGTMLAQARVYLKGKRAALLKGSAEQIPLKDRSVDVVFASMIWHALSSPPLAVKEINRVLRPGGFAIIRQSTKNMPVKSLLFKFFPEARKLTYALVPSRRDITANFEKSGFRQIGFKIVKYPYAKDFNDYLSKIRLQGISILRMLPESVMDKNLAKLKNFCKIHGHEKKVYAYRDLFVFKKF